MNIYIYISFYLKSLILKNNLNTLDNFHQDKFIHLWKLTQIWINTRLKKVLCFRYGVLLTQRLPVASDREQTVALLDMFCTEEGQYQLGLTKVPPCPVCDTDFDCTCQHVLICVCVCVCGRCSSRSFCTSSWRRSGAAPRPGLPSPSRGT